MNVEQDTIDLVRKVRAENMWFIRRHNAWLVDSYIRAHSRIGVALFLFYYRRQALGALFRFLSYLVVFRYEVEKTIKAALQKILAHVFGPPLKKQLHFYAVALLEPFGGTFCFHLQVVLAGRRFHLDILNFHCLRPRFLFFVLFILIVLPFTVVHYFGDRRLGFRGYFDQILTGLFCLFKRLIARQDTEIFTLFFVNDTKFRRAYAAVDIDLWSALFGFLFATFSFHSKYV